MQQSLLRSRFGVSHATAAAAGRRLAAPSAAARIGAGGSSSSTGSWCRQRASPMPRPLRAAGTEQQAAPATPAAAAASSSSNPGSAALPGADLVPENDGAFNISKVSFGSILTPVGLFLMVYGFGSYFMLLPGTSLSSLLLIYGFPMSLLGFALSYAQLPPVPCRTTRAARALRDAQATDIQRQVREDTTRFRYGDEQHLDEALDRVWRFGRQGNPPKKLSPRLVGLREEVVALGGGTGEEGRYCLTLEFETKLDEAAWRERLPKYKSFFGPGVEARLEFPAEGRADVLLVTDGSGAGRGGGERKDVLPPLMPGLPARKQQ